MHQQEEEAVGRPALVEFDAWSLMRLGKWDASGVALYALCNADENTGTWMSSGGNTCAKYPSNSGGKDGQTIWVEARLVPKLRQSVCLLLSRVRRWTSAK